VSAVYLSGAGRLGAELRISSVPGKAAFLLSRAGWESRRTTDPNLRTFSLSQLLCAPWRSP